MTPHGLHGEASARDIAIGEPDAPSQPFEVLTSQVDTVRESLDELNYRSTVLALHAASDDRTHLDLLSEEMAASLRRFRIAAETAIDTSRRVSASFGMTAAQQTLADLVGSSPDSRRSQLAEQLRELEVLVATTRDRLARGGGMVASNHLLIMQSLDALIGSKEHKVTYQEPAVANPRLLDHRA
ncbi:MAG: hypothetical protein GY708_02765 [Actinomycetia bacterium]|nr:hypothetical protein [Actinomycetes bacterium]